MKNILISFTLLISFFSCKYIVDPKESEISSINYNPKKIHYSNDSATFKIEYLATYNTNNQLTKINRTSPVSLPDRKSYLYPYLNDSTTYEYVSNKLNIQKYQDIEKVYNYSNETLSEYFYSYDSLLYGSSNSPKKHINYSYHYIGNQNLDYILKNNNNQIDSIVPQIKQICPDPIDNISNCAAYISLQKYKDNLIQSHDSIYITDNLVKIYTNNFQTIFTIEYFDSFELKTNPLLIEFLVNSLSSFWDYRDAYRPIFDKYNSKNNTRPVKRFKIDYINDSILNPIDLNFEYQVNNQNQITLLKMSSNESSGTFTFEY